MLAVVAAASFGAAGCGGGDNGDDNALTDEENLAVEQADITIGSACTAAATGVNLGKDLSEADDAAGEIAALLRDNPNAVYMTPGQTNSEPLIEVALDVQDTLLNECPLGTGQELLSTIRAVGPEVEN